MSNIGRNDPCPCGSGKKYKKCCLIVQDQQQHQQLLQHQALMHKLGLEWEKWWQEDQAVGMANLQKVKQAEQNLPIMI